jgi:hypothetical protein
VITDRRVPRPILVLLLLLAALLAPGASSGAAATTTAVVSRAAAPTSSTEGTAPHRSRSGADHRSERPEVRGAAAATTAVPLPATPARDARLAAPRLLLVQRPRPPTTTYAASAVSAPTGRSPPSPAGT